MGDEFGFKVAKGRISYGGLRVIGLGWGVV